MTKIILASGSPRRRELLKMAGFSFNVIPADVDENADSSLSPRELVAFLSNKKARHISNTMSSDTNIAISDNTGLNRNCYNTIIIGADTVVAIDNLILGKPIDYDDAFRMLSRLQGNMHTVYTGVTVISPNSHQTFVESTKVYMRALSDEQIYKYIATGEPFDKAGAYGIQERGAVLIEKVEGDYFTVVGLPLCKLNAVLEGICL